MIKNMRHSLFYLVMLISCFLPIESTAHDLYNLMDQEKSFVFVIPSYNNSEWFEMNLDSIFEQSYQNFRVIYIDDASTDGTGNLVQQYIDEKGLQSKITLIRNQKNLGALANIYNAVHMCKPNEIIVTVDGDDFLHNSSVLDYLNSVYQNPDVWLTYGQFVEWPVNKVPTWVHEIPQVTIETNSYRHYDWVATHLRTFYAGLFQKIRKEDFLDKETGSFYMATYDMAIMFPMLEMAGGHSRFIPEVLYIYNTANQLNDHKVRKTLQQKLDRVIRGLPQYHPLERLDATESDLNSFTSKVNPDLIVFSYDRPLQLYAFLESVDKFVTNVGRITVIYRTSSAEYDAAYGQCFDTFKNLSLVLRKQNSQNDFQELTMQALNGASNYVMFAVDDDMVTDYVDLDDVVKYLQQTNAYAFYFRLGENITECYTMNKPDPVPGHSLIDDKVLKWQLSDGQYDWNYPNNVDMTVYRTNDIISAIRSLSFSSPNTLELEWHKAGNKSGAHSYYGLCYRRSKIVNIPFNMVQQDFTRNRHMNYTKDEFLQLFNEGHRLDVNKYANVDTKALHVEMPLYLTKKTTKYDGAKIGLCITATNKYTQFLESFLNSCRNYFFHNRSVTYFVFTNQPIQPQADVVVVPVEHQPWPGPTLMRFENYYKAFEQWKQMDYMFACDVDMRFVAPAGDEMLGDRIAVLHPGFYNKSRSAFTYEDQNTASKAYVGLQEGKSYYAGGFYGGSTKEFLRLVKTNSENIRADLAHNNFVAKWHDESHLNRYFIDNEPTVKLSPAYCYPESWSLPFNKILLALDKDHKKVREDL